MGEWEPGRLFDVYYFAHGCGEPYERSEIWLTLFDGFAERIYRDIRPGTVLDAGCALGLLVEMLRKRGVQAWGVDISEYAMQNASPEAKPYCWIGSVAEPFPQRYDLIVCIEVLEHLPKEAGEAAVANFCRHSDDVLFSSTPFDHTEASHFNVQPTEYWTELFARHGFFRDVDFDAAFITPWAVRYRKKDEPVHRIVRDYERRFWQLWKENTDLRALTLDMRNQLAEGEQKYRQMESELKEKDRETKERLDGWSGWGQSFIRKIRRSSGKLGDRDRETR